LPQPSEAEPSAPGRRKRTALLLAMVLIIATAGLVYELVMAAVASYVLGDSVTQFSIVIGVYLSALGLGAYISRFIERDLAATFVNVELGAALLGGFSAPALFLAYGFTHAFAFILYACCVAVGTLVGLELPLLIRILERQISFKELIARALTFDYAGALLGSLAFSLFLVPELGLVHTSLACGMLNALVALASTFVLDLDLRDRPALVRARLRAVLVLVLLLLGMVQGERVLEASETAIFGGQQLIRAQSRYQRVVLSEHPAGLTLHLNGNLQFASADEHRYHEALVHPALGATPNARSVLIAGGGDGLAAREVLRWPGVREVTLVDLDPLMTDLFRSEPRLTHLNRGALSNPKLSIVNEDAFVWLGRQARRFDVMIFDFPDPSNYSLGKLYSDRMYRMARARLTPGGTLVVQATSPLFARTAFWCVIATLENAGFHVHPYRVFVPSFGEWGFALARQKAAPLPLRLPEAKLRYLDAATLRELFSFAKDMQRVPAQTNRLNNQALVGYYLREWARWN
jgi:spermidine synthase